MCLCISSWFVWGHYWGPEGRVSPGIPLCFTSSHVASSPSRQKISFRPIGNPLSGLLPLTYKILLCTFPSYSVLNLMPQFCPQRPGWREFTGSSWGPVRMGTHSSSCAEWSEAGSEGTKPMEQSWRGCPKEIAGGGTKSQSTEEGQVQASVS